MKPLTPELNGQPIIEGYAIDELEDCYEILDPVKETDHEGLEIIGVKIAYFRKKLLPYCVTVDHENIVAELHFWVEGVEKKEMRG